MPVIWRSSSLEMDTMTRGQTLDVAICISHNADTLRKGMNSTILLSAIGKSQNRLKYLTLEWQLV